MRRTDVSELERNLGTIPPITGEILVDGAQEVVQALHVGPFAAHAMELFELNFTVFPLQQGEKVPSVSRIQKWKRGPQHQTLTKWIAQYCSYNIGIHLWSSRLVVIDADEQGLAEKIIEIIGDTPLKVNTRRGQHLYFEVDRGLEHVDFREFGIEADLKGANRHDIVVAPGSIHPETGQVYSLSEGSHLSHRHNLPKLTKDMLNRLCAALGQVAEKKSSGPTSRSPGPVPSGQRAVTLNKHLCGQVHDCDDIETLLDVAETYCAEFDEPESFPQEEIERRTRQVWEDAQNGKLEDWRGKGSLSQPMEWIKQLAPLKSAGSNAVVLLMVLVQLHAARVKRGETFTVCTRAMAKAGSVAPEWKEHHYKTALNVLRDTGFVVFVKKVRLKASSNPANHYTFGPGVGKAVG